MQAERASFRAGSTLRLGLVVGLLLVALPRPAIGQGIGLAQLMEMLVWGNGSLILVDQFEYGPGGAGRPLRLEAVGWWGGDYNRLWFRAEGEQLTTERVGDGELQLSYGRLVTPYFDALAGGRIDQQWGDESSTRAHFAVGVVGLAPGRFEVSQMLFMSLDGDVSARLDAEYQLLVTQRWVATPEIELNAALQEVSEWGVGSGINDVELGLRLRYEFHRKFAPYIGYSWTRRLGGSAEFAREAGEGISESVLVAGLRVWR